MGRMRRALERLTADEHQHEQRERVRLAEAAGATPVGACQQGQPVCVSGSLRSVTLRPLAGVPTLEAELDDGSGSVRLVWLGRRRIGGIECGRSLVARGRLTAQDGRPTIYNAAYELRPPGA